MTLPLFSEGAVPLGSNDRTVKQQSDCNLSPPAHHNAPAGTSEVAAKLIAEHSPNLRDRVFAFIASRGTEGATDDEGERALSVTCSTYTPRRGELVKQGVVVDSGLRRNTAAGRPAAVWIASIHIRNQGVRAVP